MDNFVVKKNVHSKIWPYFIEWFNEQGGTVDCECNFFGILFNKPISFEKLDVSDKRVSLISLELWNLFIYSRFPSRFVIKSEKSSPYWNSFIEWFSKESDLYIGESSWEYYGKDDSPGSNGFKVSDFLEDFNTPISLTSVKNWHEARTSKVNFEVAREYDGSLTVGDIVECEDYIFGISKIEWDEYLEDFVAYDKWGDSYVLEDVTCISEKLVSTKGLSADQIDIIHLIVDAFKNQNDEI